jgi:hypothetical protein
MASRRSAPCRRRHAAVGSIDDQREALAEAELGREIRQLHGGADGRHVRRDRHEDAVGDLEDRLVERAVRGMEIDDDVVEAATGGVDQRGDPRRLEDLVVQRRRRQRYDPQAGGVGRG